MPIEFIIRNQEDTYMCFTAKTPEVSHLEDLNAHRIKNVVIAFTKYSQSSNFFMECILNAEIPDQVTPEWIYQTLLIPYMASKADKKQLNITPFFLVDAYASYQITERAQLITGRQIISHGFHETLIFNYYDRFLAGDPLNEILTLMMSSIKSHSKSYLGHTIIYQLKSEQFMHLEGVA